jgi:hypothetical protein
MYGAKTAFLLLIVFGYLMVSNSLIKENPSIDNKITIGLVGLL